MRFLRHKRHLIKCAALTLPIIFCGVFFADAGASEEKAEGWLSEDWTDARERIQEQFRGMAVAMMEVGHRFDELYWAGRERNWDYAEYQLKEIEALIKLAVERRPQRAASAEVFLSEDFPEAARLIRQRNPESFVAGMRHLQVSCMKCHAAENVPFIAVRFPSDGSSRHPWS